MYRWQQIPAEASPAVRAALEAEAIAAEVLAEPPVRVVQHGISIAWPTRGMLRLEDGATLAIDTALPADVPLGYHEFYPDHGRSQTRVIVVPRQCVLPAGGQWGWAVQLYSARSARSWGIGDLADLRRLAHWSGGLGASLLLVNPLAAAAPGVPQQPSPYYPVSRRFRNPLYLAVEEVPGAERLGEELARLAALGQALNAERRLDRDRVFRVKDEALRALWAGFGDDPRFADYCRRQGGALEQFARYAALATQFGGDWRNWPAEYRHPRAAAVAQFAADRGGEVRYHQWLQWLLDEQLARAAAALPLVQDLPIGMDPGGADAWEWQDLLAGDFTVGAPPDPFNAAGQNWQLPPLVPQRLWAAGYEPFIQTIRATLAHGRGLRIDHVMGLFRLWWIPVGGQSAQGTYVRYPAEDLLGIVALESQRSGGFIVGEDLGTVEPGVRERLAAANILGVRLLYFEPRPPAEYPALTMAAANTHDLPTIAGMWSGADLAAQAALGMPVNDDMRGTRGHCARIIGVPDSATAVEAIEATYRALATAPSLVVLASLEDALAIEERPNMPGTIFEWPNWSLAWPGGLESLEASPLARRIAAALRRT
jgi:4-alpha-glucanotransferase